MKKFLKEIFSSDNLKKAMIGMLLSNPNLTAREYEMFSNEFRNMERKAENKEISQAMAKVKKAS